MSLPQSGQTSVPPSVRMNLFFLNTRWCGDQELLYNTGCSCAASSTRGANSALVPSSLIHSYLSGLFSRFMGGTPVLEQLSKWFSLIKSAWWGIIAVYALALFAVHSAIWVLIDPLSLPDKLYFLGSTVDRRVVHISAAIIIAANLTLILVIVSRWVQHVRDMQRSHQPQETPREADLSPIVPRSWPKMKDLLTDRIDMKDGKMDKAVFATRVLLALNCGEIREETAHTLLPRNRLQRAYHWT